MNGHDLCPTRGHRAVFYPQEATDEQPNTEALNKTPEGERGRAAQSDADTEAPRRLVGLSPHASRQKIPPKTDQSILLTSTVSAKVPFIPSVKQTCRVLSISLRILIYFLHTSPPLPSIRSFPQVFLSPEVFLNCVSSRICFSFQGSNIHRQPKQMCFRVFIARLIPQAAGSGPSVSALSQLKQ